jgi:hypothetical protein
MKKIAMLLFSFLTFSVIACEKEKLQHDDDLYAKVPSGTVPAQLASGTWFSGTLSAISYFDRDGHQLRNDYEAGREYQFSNVNGKGRIKFWQYLGTGGFSTCTTEIFYL